MYMCVCTGKGCVALCIENMQRVQELSPIELVEMFVTVFCFLKDSSEVSQVLLDDFRAANGYMFLTEFLLKFVPFILPVFCFFQMVYSTSVHRLFFNNHMSVLSSPKHPPSN